jgi:hypothetical protein
MCVTTILRFLYLSPAPIAQHHGMVRPSDNSVKPSIRCQALVNARIRRRSACTTGSGCRLAAISSRV